jgi:hypothetical protein
MRSRAARVPRGAARGRVARQDDPGRGAPARGLAEGAPSGHTVHTSRSQAALGPRRAARRTGARRPGCERPRRSPAPPLGRARVRQSGVEPARRTRRSAERAARRRRGQTLLPGTGAERGVDQGCGPSAAPAPRRRVEARLGAREDPPQPGRAGRDVEHGRGCGAPAVRAPPCAGRTATRRRWPTASRAPRPAAVRAPGARARDDGFPAPTQHAPARARRRPRDERPRRRARSAPAPSSCSAARGTPSASCAAPVRPARAVEHPRSVRARRDAHRRRAGRLRRLEQARVQPDHPASRSATQKRAGRARRAPGRRGRTRVASRKAGGRSPSGTRAAGGRGRGLRPPEGRGARGCARSAGDSSGRARARPACAPCRESDGETRSPSGRSGIIPA